MQRTIDCENPYPNPFLPAQDGVRLTVSVIDGRVSLFGGNQASFHFTMLRTDALAVANAILELAGAAPAVSDLVEAP